MPAVERKTEHVKILQDLGYDPWEIENDDDMLSALKEATNDLSRENPSDGRIPMLQDAVKGLRRPKFKEKKTTIKGSKFMGKETKKNSPIRDKTKLLSGSGFENKDLEKSEAEQGEDKKGDIIAFLNGEVNDKLDEINTSLGEIKDVVGAQGDLAEERDEDMRQAILAANKKKREGKLEGKKTLKDKMLESVTKPVGNFLNKLLKFVMMTFVGSYINRVLSLLKDPAQFLDPIKRFFNLIVGMVNAVVKGLWKITGAPLNFIIGGINNGVASLIDSLNKATALLNIPAQKAPQIPLVPGPPEYQFIPLSETAQAAKNEAVGMAGGGVVPGVDGLDGIDGMESVGIDGMDGMESVGIDGMDGAPGIAGVGLDGADGLQGLPGLGGGGGGTDAITAKATTKSLGKRGKDIGNLFARPFRTKEDRLNADPRSQFASGIDQPKGFSGGGIVPAPYPVGDNILGLSPSFSGLPGYNKGGKVPGKGEGDIVPAMLTPGEFVMSKGAVDQIGTDNLMEMNAAGGGTNQPKLMKFAGGGIVPGIDAPNKKGGKVVVIGGGGGSSAPRGGGSSDSSGEDTPKFSSTDPNNINVTVIKSIYNIMN